MPRSRWISVSMASLALLATGGCRDTKGEAKERAALELVALKAEAGKACRCEQRDGSAEKACWKTFEAAMKRKNASSGGTMCDPVAERTSCWTANGRASSPSNPEQCITTAYDVYTFHRGGTLVCTEQEAKAVEQALNQAGGPEASQAQRDAADALVRDIVQGKRFAAAPPNTPGCV